MTEDDWLKSDVMPERMVVDLHTARYQGQVAVSDRKLRLFSCACCRRVENRIRDERVRQVLDVVERHLDGLAADGELQAAADAIERVLEGIQTAAAAKYPGAGWPSVPVPAVYLVEAAANAAGRTPGSRMTGGWFAVAMKAAMNCRLAVMYDVSEHGTKHRPLTNAEVAIHRAILRDCLGNPFRSVTRDPAWLAWNEGAVPKLARAIHDDRAFARLPVLADALEDAGCRVADVLAHCRQPGEHVRGCWVVDLLTAGR